MKTEIKSSTDKTVHWQIAGNKTEDYVTERCVK